MSNQPFMQLYVGDYLADTTHLTTEQHGAYMLLLLTMWRHGGKLPNEPQKLARIARTTGRKWPSIWAEIEAFFVVEGDLITNNRLTKEYQKAVSKSELRADAGSRGGKAKALKTKNTSVANASGLLYHSSEPEPEREKRDTKVSPKKERGSRLSDDWVLPKEWGEWAVAQGWSETAIRLEADKFRDFWISKAGKDAVKLDWLATWRNWVRNSKTPKVITGGKHDKPTKQSERLNAFIAGARGTS
jgi:uncharacterized protein YdaU (DUF1376 family)